MNKTAFIYDDIFLKHEMPIGHPEKKERLIAITERLKKSEIWNKLIHIKPEKADITQINAVHTKNYIDYLRNFRSGYFDSDTYISEHTLEVSQWAAGAVIEAISKIKEGTVETAFCAVRPPGHHAEKNMAMGFCIFNNAAIGARFAQSIGYEKIFIIDFDVHHGNGTQHIFYDDDTVFYFSSHQYPFYPGTGNKNERGIHKGLGYTLNVPLEAGSGDEEYSEVYSKILPEQLQIFKPDLIIVSSGYDIRTEDPLASMEVSNEGIRNIVNSILDCRKTDSNKLIPAVFVLEGGYNLNALAESAETTLEVMLKKEYMQ